MQISKLVMPAYLFAFLVVNIPRFQPVTIRKAVSIMFKSSLFKRRQLLYLGGTGVVSVLGGAAVTKALDTHAGSSTQPDATSSPQNDKQPYLNPAGFDQQFLAKSADIKQIWDFVTIDQIYPQGLNPIRNAINAFQFTYKKTLYPVICLRGNAVIYGLDDAMWTKYRLVTVSDQSNKTSISGNPLYHQQSTDLSQDSSLQGLQQRGVHVVLCHDALSGLAGNLEEKRGFTTDTIYSELAAHLVPGAQLTPSGSSLIAVAQHLGFTYAKQ